MARDRIPIDLTNDAWPVLELLIPPTKPGGHLPQRRHP